MGYEVCYKYYERVDGEYKKDELKEFKRKVGDPFEDVPLEKLSFAITAQLARRDIWIVDVEVFELSKKKVAFKETKGGIVLKNKKFLFDSFSGGFKVENEEETQSVEESTEIELNEEIKNIQPHNITTKTQSKQRRAIDVLVYSPEPQQLIEAKRKNLKLTIDKKYEVFQKKTSPTGLGDLCLIIDDAGKEQFVSDMYFVPANINLFGDKELGFSDNQKDDISLSWGNASLDSNMPNIRRR
jgi:hypothetical protein